MLKGLLARLGLSNGSGPAEDAGGRRGFERRSVALPVILRVDGAAHECRIADVSATGAFLAPHHGIDTGARGVLELPAVSIRAELTVVRRTDEGLGVAFENDAVGAIVAGWARGQSTQAG